ECFAIHGGFRVDAWWRFVLRAASYELCTQDFAYIFRPKFLPIARVENLSSLEFPLLIYLVCFGFREAFRAEMAHTKLRTFHDIHSVNNALRLFVKFRNTIHLQRKITFSTVSLFDVAGSMVQFHTIRRLSGAHSEQGIKLRSGDRLVTRPLRFVPLVDQTLVDRNRQFDSILAVRGVLRFCQRRREGSFQLTNLTIKWYEVILRKQADKRARILARFELLRTVAQ